MSELNINQWYPQLIKLKSLKELSERANAEAIGELNAFVRDESVPLFDRWCAFMENSSLLPVASYASGIPRNVLDLLKARYDFERYQTIIFSDYFEEDWFSDNDGCWVEEDKACCREDFESIPVELVMGIITSGYRGFEYDW